MKLHKFLKIESIEEIRKYKLLHPATIFIFDFNKQKKEVDAFLRNKNFVTIRTDKKNNLYFCPCDLRCPRSRARQSIKEFISKGYVVILQRYIPIRKDRKVSGNILILKNYILVELMGKGPLTWLNRNGKIEEQIKFKKRNLKEIEHFGKRLIKRGELTDILKLVKNVPNYKILEFTLMTEGYYFWQIKNDETAKKLE
ncbi:MAG: hypothetical protein AUK06_01630 [Parcubacteria group bacterium CG2_30_36_18]|nr:MAG: hypothetical protein AUK06_01630 [Parcubacteria group bacterium CG2_30_36_18]